MALGGDLRNINLADLFQTLSMNRQVGTLLVRNGEKEKRILFSPRGVSLCSSRTIPGFRLGRYLLRTGTITEDELSIALQHQQKSGGLLGAVLVNLGLCSSEAVEEVVRYHVAEELYEIFTWAKGEFEFLEGVVPDEHSTQSPLSEIAMEPGTVVMEAARRIDEWTMIGAELRDPNELFTPTGKAGLELEVETWGRDAANVYRLVDGSRTVGAILRVSYLSEFDTSSTLLELMKDGYIRRSTFAEITAAAWTALDQKAPEKAAPCLERASVLQPRDTAILDQLVDCYDRLDDNARGAATLVRLADLLAESGMVAEAIANLDKAKRLDPRCIDAHVRLFRLNREQGDDKSALKAARLASEFLLDRSDYATAGQICREGLEISLEDRTLQLALADAYAGAGRREDALSELERLATQLEVARDTRVLELVCKRILQIDSSRRSYLERLRELKEGEVRLRRKRIRMIAATVAFVGLLAGSFFAFSSGTSAGDLLEEAREIAAAGDLKAASTILDELMGRDLDDETYIAVQELSASIHPKLRPTETQAEKRTTEIENELDEHFRPVIEALEGQRVETALQHLSQLVNVLSTPEISDRLRGLGAPERKRVTSRYAKSAREALGLYAAKLSALLEENRERIDSTPDPRMVEANELDLDRVFRDVTEIRSFLDPVIRSSIVSLCESVEVGLCDGERTLSRKVESCSGEIDALYDLVDDRYHALRARTLRRKYLDDFVAAQKSIKDLLRQGKIPEGRAECQAFLDGCRTLGNQVPTEFYGPVIDELLGEQGLDLDQRTEEQMSAIDSVLRTLEESEDLIAARRFAEANALLRETIDRNLKISFQEHAHLVMCIRTRPAGAEVLGSWNGEERESLGFTTPEGLVVRYKPHGETVLKVRLDTYRPITIRVEDFLDEVPATPDFELEKLPEWTAEKLGPLDAGPVVVDGTVLLASRDGHLRGLSVATGEIVFDRDFHLLGGFSSSPLVENGIAYLATPDRACFAFDLAKGEVLWKFETAAPARTSPVRCSGMTVVADEDGNVFGVEAGRAAWRQALPGHLKSAPTGRGDRFLAATVEGLVLCLDGRTGTELWRRDLGAPTYVPLVTTSTGALLVATENARLTAMSIEDGRVLWSAAAENALRRTPVAEGDMVFAVTLDGLALKFDLRTGEKLAAVPLLTETTVDGGFAASGGTVCFADSTGLFIVADYEQGLLWRRELTGRVWSPPYFANGRLIVTTDAGTVLCFKQ